MKLTSQQYAQALYEAVQQTHPKDHETVLENFAKVLAQNGDLGKYEEISEVYKILEMKAKGITQASVTVAREMEINRGILDELNKIAGDKLDIKQKVDEGLVGGMVVRVDETLIDASVKRQLSNLKQQLKS